MMAKLNLLEQHAQEKAGLGPEWEPWLWERYPKTNDPAMYYQLTGAIAPRITRGPRKGRRNWKKRDPQTERIVVITIADQEAYEARWSAETGKCIRCTGDGQVIARVHHIEGASYKPCHVCGGTGNAKVAEPVGAAS